jgi:hypothetical protein
VYNKVEITIKAFNKEDLPAPTSPTIAQILPFIISILISCKVGFELVFQEKLAFLYNIN